MNQKPRTILVVDDDVDATRNLQDILTDLGYAVQTAPNGPSALELVRRAVFDVALLDFKMPGMDGLSLYREIKKISPATVAILITAYLGTTDAEARTAGTWKVLTKPVDLSRLLPLVDEAAHQPLVLVIDDDRDLCANLWDLFRDQGYRVSLAHTTAAARDLLKQQPDIRVVLLDLKLPNEDGTAIMGDLRQACPQSRTILITGHQQELGNVIRRVLAEGADSVCYKPFAVAELLQTVERLAQPTKSSQ
jgi:two-component system response regulator HydG